MKAIILAAGRGSRMKDMTEAVPKCLVELQGQSLLDRQLAALRSAGLTDIGIVTGYRRELLLGHGLHEFHNARWAETNMVTSLACAEEWLISTPCIVSYSDIFYEPSAIALLMKSTADLAITFDPNWLSLWTRRFGDPLLDAETFRLGENGDVMEIGGKPASVDDIQGQYMGLLRFTPFAWTKISAFLDTLPPETRDRMHCTGLLQSLIHRGDIPVKAEPYQGAWGEIDSPEDWALFENRL